MGEKPNPNPAPPAPQADVTPGVTPGTSRTMTTAGAPVPGAPVEKPAPPAQSEIGPTTYGGPGGPVAHGANDPETKAAYASGHPSQGIAAQRAATQANAPAQPFRPGQTNPEGTTPNPQGTTTAQTQRVHMLRDESGHSANQDVAVPADEAQRLIASGAARAIG